MKNVNKQSITEKREIPTEPNRLSRLHCHPVISSFVVVVSSTNTHKNNNTHFFLQRKLSTASSTFTRRPQSPELHQFTPQSHDLITLTRPRRLTRHQINSESWQKKNSFFRLQNVSFSVDAHESAQFGTNFALLSLHCSLTAVSCFR